MNNDIYNGISQLYEFFKELETRIEKLEKSNKNKKSEVKPNGE